MLKNCHFSGSQYIKFHFPQQERLSIVAANSPRSLIAKLFDSSYGLPESVLP
jgi:hypothetical protein